VSIRTLTQEDPIGLTGGLNLYGFAGGDPINFWDPFELCKDENGNDLPEGECRKKLAAAQDKARAAYPRDEATGQTYCNKATMSIVSSMNENIPGYVPGETTAEQIGGLLASPESGWVSVTAQQAQGIANRGDVVIAYGIPIGAEGEQHAHVATVRTAWVEPMKGSGVPIINQIGYSTGIRSVSWSFMPAQRTAGITYYAPAGAVSFP
jgi:hypothetical protein